MWIRQNNVFKTHSEIRRDNPNVSIPAVITDTILAELGYEIVKHVVPEYNDNTHRAIEQSPIRDNGEWMQSWRIEELDVDSLAEIQQEVEFAQTQAKSRQARIEIKADAVFGTITANEASNKVDQIINNASSVQVGIIKILKSIIKFIIYIRDRG